MGPTDLCDLLGAGIDSFLAHGSNNHNGEEDSNRLCNKLLVANQAGELVNEGDMFGIW